jgi:hypothetical protein
LVWISFLVYADDVNIVGRSVRTVEENTEALVIWQYMLITLSTWSCFEIRRQDEVTIRRLIIDPLKWWKSSNIWKQF